MKRMLLVFAILTIGSSMVFADFEPGKIYHGFELLEKRFVPEVNAECFYFSHQKSGARLFKIAADDANKTFSIAFKTIPESDAGTPHIMEHCVLNGSKNFPVKSPFDVLAKGSLNTFLNAMTGGDITIYPVASMNDKDYFNLMHVYLDAVFHPLIYSDQRILKQEGWHHELADAESPVVYKGVVYNEMKGAYSSPTRELGYQVDKNLFPDNAYRFSSGGYPQAIPTLTQEDFLDFHRKYYHPSNSYLYLYGDADLDKELDFINQKYLSNYNKSDKEIGLKDQRSFDKMKKVTAYYSATEGSETENQTYLTLNFVAGKNIDRKLVLALDILEAVLVDQESAPLRMALQEAGVGREVNASVDNMKQNVFQIRVQNANPQDTEKFKTIVSQTLKDVVENGLDQEAVEGTLNRIEFRLREGDDAQKGLTYNFQMLDGWFWAEDPFLSLEYEKPLAEIKKAVENGYLEEVIQKYLLDNNHALLLVLEPKPGLEATNNDKVEAELIAFKNNLSEQEKQELIKETEQLIAYQEREDNPEALETIPLLDLADINPKAEWYEVSGKEIGEVPVLHYETFSNNVIYMNLQYDLRVLPAELIPYAALMAEVLGSLNSEKYTYGELDKALNLHTGGFNTYLTNYLKDRDDEKMMPKFVVSSKAMNNKIDKLFMLADEIVNRTKYVDTDRLKAVITRHQSRLDANIKRDGLGYARTRMASYFNKSGMFSELTRGVEYYWFVTDLAQNFDEKSAEIVDNLVSVSNILFTKNNLMVSVTCSSDDQPIFEEELQDFISAQKTKEAEIKSWEFELSKKNEGLLAASKVQYILQGYNFKKLGYQWDGTMRVLDQMLSRDYLYNRIRVIGGAYGGFSSFSSNGTVYFGSYRDPNLKETLDNYDGAVDYIKSFEADEKDMTRYIIGTIARMDRPLTPSQKGNVAVRRYLEGITKTDMQSDRESVLKVSVKDIRQMEKMVKEILAQDSFCVYGNAEKIQEQKELFKKVVNLNP